MPEAVVILCTAPSAEVAETLARGLVEARLAACVNVIAGVTSIYRWKDAVQRDSEVQLVIKTRDVMQADVTKWIVANHPYEMPEVIVLPIISGSAPYLEWIARDTGGGEPE